MKSLDLQSERYSSTGQEMLNQLGRSNLDILVMRHDRHLCRGALTLTIAQLSTYITCPRLRACPYACCDSLALPSASSACPFPM